MGAEGPLVLVDDRGGRHLVSLGDRMVRVPGLGVLASERLRQHLGRTVTVGDRRLLVLPASSRDRMEGLARRPQTIGPKDAASILFHAGISPDDVVIEAGAGSGWLTIALAAAVGPRGRVIAYEKREDFAMFARENVERTGMGAGVEIRVGDVVAEMREQEVAAVVLDLPEPWTVVSAAWKALRIGGTFASFSPTVEQVRRTVEALAGQPFADVRTIEVIEREMVVRGTGTRPSSAPVGHTGYLTFARKVLETL